MSKLNNRLIERARPGASDKYIADGDGLFLRVTPSGTKTFCFRYSIGAERRLLALGPYPLLSLGEARGRAGEARKLVFDGVDPMERAKTAKSSGRELSTVRLLVQDWTERYARKH